MSQDFEQTKTDLPGFAEAMPEWVPPAVQNYVGHTEMGIPIRALARHRGCHASTVLRQIRRVETLRDDPLVDGMLSSLGSPGDEKQAQAPVADASADATLGEGLDVLRQMCASGTVLAVAAEMEKAVIVRVHTDGGSTRMGVVDRTVAEALALREWIATDAPGRITRYKITTQGRAAVAQDAEETGGSNRTPGHGRVRYSVIESPVAALARRRDRDGEPFLTIRQLRAGEHLREDFELARLGPRLGPVWELFHRELDGKILPDRPSPHSPAGRAERRVIEAMQDLGPGLSEVTLRCCCYLEGLEATEKRLGWSARSGKIVLRIALMRLERYYAATAGSAAAMIG